MREAGESTNGIGVIDFAAWELAVRCRMLER